MLLKQQICLQQSSLSEPVRMLTGKQENESADVKASLGET